MSPIASRWSVAAALMLAGCAVDTSPATAPSAPAEASRAAPAVPAPKPAPKPAPPPVAAVPAKPAAASPAKPRPPASVAAQAKPQPPAPAKAPAQAAAAPLDLKTLEQRLKETNAIGVLTKLSLKNQVDDLIAKFRAYHQGARPPTLPELKPAFQLLLMKVLTLLQDHDPGLARDIDASRDAIWNVLTDPRQLAQFS
jgi:hypothetical protein